MVHNGKHHYQYLIFDLDETIYPREAGLMKAVGQRILSYMTQQLKIPADDASIKRRDYYQKYGTSLRGLMLEYNIDPTEFLNFVHDINPADFFGPSPPLDQMLRELPLRKIIFTNADVPHSERVLDVLQVRPHFEMIIDTRAVGYRSKPDPYAYHQVLARLDAPGNSCIMIEDKPRNLIPAKDLGMTTILVGEAKTSAIDFTVPTIFHVEQVIKKLLPMERL